MERNREALAAYLRGRGILYASATQPIRHRNGAPAPWAFYSWGATLTEEGLRLAALCILDRLRSFQGRQIATIGYTGMPLLCACVLLGGGRYTGLCIREARKRYVSCRRVEGPFDKNEPVVIIDDSISSGGSLARAIRAIEDEGAEVEGAIALVQFPHRGGLDWANRAGYRAEAILDIWTDLGMGHTLAGPPRRVPAPAGQAESPNGLHPASLARFAARTYLGTGLAPRPPRQMDRHYEAAECAGGVFVSFRERINENRLGREGFWHFDPAEANPCGDVIAATIDTLRVANGRITAQNLGQLKIAVTFFSALERIEPRGLDFRRYGIVAQSLVHPDRRGGALPNTQVFISEIEQYRQARETNARIVPDERHELFRHDVTKHVEPGETWLPYGMPEDESTAWWRDEALGRRITGRARELLRVSAGSGRGETNPLPDNVLPCGIAGVAVRIYDSGLVGYGLAVGTGLDEAMGRAAAQAAADPRLESHAGASCRAGNAIVVSILHHPEPLGYASMAAVARKLRRGLDALGVAHAGRTTVVLPGVLPYNDLSREGFVRTAVRLAGAEGEGEAARLDWHTFQCAEWVEEGGRPRALRFGFPDRGSHREEAHDPGALIRLLGGYILRSLGADGLPRYLLLPAAGEGRAHGTAARAMHALMALDMAGAFLNEATWCDAAMGGLRHCLDHVREGTIRLPHSIGGVLADAVLLGAVGGRPELAATGPASDLAVRLSRLLRPDGRIAAGPKRVDYPDDQEFLPGAVLTALGRFAAADASALSAASFRASIAWYARRFATCPGWGSAGWLPQGMEAVHGMTSEPGAAALAFAVTDWSLDFQLESTGAFLEDLSPEEPSFNTGFIAEGVAASWSLALDAGDAARAGRYAASWWQAVRFITRLIVFPEDLFAMRAGAVAIGGVRCTQSSSAIRIDQVSHCLHALVKGASLLSRS